MTLFRLLPLHLFLHRVLPGLVTLAAGAGPSSGRAQPAGLVLAAGGRATATIVVAADASPAERAAADELRVYLDRITGGSFPLVTADRAPAGTRILVGRVGGRDGLEDVGPQGFRLDTRDGELRLGGADDDGTEYAVYTLLEKHLGVRWYWPGDLGEVVPRRPNLVLGAVRDVQQPAFRWRNRGPGGAVWGATSGPTDIPGRERVLGVSAARQEEVRRWERRNKWGGWKIHGGHSLGEIFPPEKYAAAHPEYYALVKGRRDVPGARYNFKHGSQVCTSNPDVVRIAAEWVCDFLDRHPAYQAVHISLNDSSGYCECADCRALDLPRARGPRLLGTEQEETRILAGEAAAEKAGRAAPAPVVVTDRVFTYANAVSRLVQSRHPGKFVVMMAYMQYILPPERTRVDRHVIPQYCMWSAYKHANPRLRQQHENIAAGWARSGAAHVAMYEYYINGSWPGLHRLIVPYLTDSIRFLHRQGFDLYETQAGDEFATNGLNYYVAGKLLWDPATDVRAVLDDFYALAFGPAGPAVRRMHDRLQAAWTAATADGTDISCGRLEDTRLHLVYPPALLQQCHDDLTAAERAAGDDTVRRRVEFVRDGVRYTELTVQAVLRARAVDFDAHAAGDRAARRSRVLAAIAAVEEQRRFVEAHREDGVVPYFWARYSQEARARFLPLARLQELAKTLE